MTLPVPRAARGRRMSRRLHSQDDGFALITTVMVMALLAAFSLVVLQQTMTNTAAARKDQDWVAALSAAQAGLDDYVNRLNDTNGGYFAFTTAVPDATNPAMGSTSGAPNWAPVPNAKLTDGTRGWFHYDVDNTSYTGNATTTPNGNLLVESTGRVGKRTRTLHASVRRSGFVEYVYFTDLETPDPLTYASGMDAAIASCTAYWPTRPGPPTCSDIVFQDDRLTGPVHSNDTMIICSGNAFEDAVTTGSEKVTANADRFFRVDPKTSAGTAYPCSTTGTTFQRPGDPAQVKKISLPPTNLALKREVTATPPRGCLYVGPTAIVVKGKQIRVKSPWTKAPTPGCPADDTYFDIPVSGLVYVDVVPAATAADANAPAAGATCPPGSNGLGYPITVGATAETDWTYPCRAGDVFIQEEGGSVTHGLDGRLTVSANNNVYVTGNLDYKPTTASGSFLGLIAEQFVYVWHPIHRTSPTAQTATNLQPLTDLRISAAMLSVNHAVAVQNHRWGPSMGTLNVTGAFTQKYRGSVASSDVHGFHGYVKNYQYDQRLRHDAPPRFLNPLISSFTTVRITEKSPSYR